MRSILMAAAFVAAGVTSASALSTFRFQNDNTFNALCDACELAVGEIRGGGPSTWEIGIQDPPGSQPIQGQRDTVWGNGTINPFTLGYDGTELRLTIAGGPSTTAILLGGMQSIFIRARSVDADNKLEFTDLKLMSAGETHDIGNLDFFGGGSAGANYVQVGGIDFSNTWALTGNAVFSWAGSSIPSNSALGGTFKLTDVAPVPLPAAAWLLLAASGGLIAAKRRAASNAA